MYCPHCGRAVPDGEGARFCRSCGGSLGLPAESTDAPASTSSEERYGATSTSAAGNADAGDGGWRGRGAVLAANIGPAAFVPARPVLYAGFWRRFGAAIVDGILLTIVTVLVGFVIGFLFALAAPQTNLGEAFGGIAGYVIGFLYYPVLESSSAQATWGKRALGIKVTDLDGRKISFWRALGRYLGKLLSTFLLFFGYLMAAFTSRKQGLHDIMAGTLVVMDSGRDDFS